MVLVEIYTKKRLSRSLCVRVVLEFVLRCGVVYERKRRVSCWVNGEGETSIPLVLYDIRVLLPIAASFNFNQCGTVFNFLRVVGCRDVALCCLLCITQFAFEGSSGICCGSSFHICGGPLRFSFLFFIIIIKFYNSRSPLVFKKNEELKRWWTRHRDSHYPKFMVYYVSPCLLGHYHM